MLGVAFIGPSRGFGPTCLPRYGATTQGSAAQRTFNYGQMHMKAVQHAWVVLAWLRMLCCLQGVSGTHRQHTAAGYAPMRAWTGIGQCWKQWECW